MLSLLVAWEPLAQMSDDVLEVLQPEGAGSYGVIRQVFLNRRGVVAVVADLLHAIAVLGISSMLLDKLIEIASFLDGIALAVGEVAVGPVDGILIVRTDGGRVKAHSTVFGLGNIVEARIVHDRGRRTVHGREGGRAERVDRVCSRCSHVVHEAEGVADLVCDDVLERLGHQRIGELHRSDEGVDLSRLDEAPVVVQLRDITPDEYRGIDDLTRTGVSPAGPHSVLGSDGHVANTVVLEVVGVEVGVIRGEVTHLDSVLEANSLESLIPAQRTLLHRSLPHCGEGILYVEDDRLLGANELTSLVGSDIRGLEAPALSEAHGLDLLGLGVVGILRDVEDTDTRISQTGRHRLLGQAEDGEGRPESHGVVLQRALSSTRGVEGDAVATVDLDGDVVLEGLDLADVAEVTLQA